MPSTVIYFYDCKRTVAARSYPIEKGKFAVDNGRMRVSACKLLSPNPQSSHNHRFLFSTFSQTRCPLLLSSNLSGIAGRIKHYNHLCGTSFIPSRISKFSVGSENGRSEAAVDVDDDGKQQLSSGFSEIGSSDVEDQNFFQGNTAIISACFVGLLTGISVVLFNLAVHEIRDLCWDGSPHRGTSWLREEPTQLIWQRVVLIPTFGGLIVGLLNSIRGYVEKKETLSNNIKSTVEPVLKAVAACVTLGTGNSLGPEGPSVEIGASVAKLVGSVFDRGGQIKTSLRAAGSAAGISSGFNAAVAGCFFAVESVLWPSTDSSLSLSNTTSAVILSGVIASVISEIGLGNEPAFTVPPYDFRSPSELPLYLLLGIICGLVSLTLSSCTSFMVSAVDKIQNKFMIPKSVLPIVGGLSVGLIALSYPEILYRGFENVDLLLESGPAGKGLSAYLLLQLVAVKIVTTSLCRASGLVGGYYAPSLFIGAATGMAYGKFAGYVISQENPAVHLSFLVVASPQAYGLVGMAATLAGVCQVPLTSVLLLFELTQDYRIVLPLLGAVSLTSWITSGSNTRRRVGGGDTVKLRPLNNNSAPQLQTDTNLCEIESSLCLEDSSGDYENETQELAKRIIVSQAMRTRYITVLMTTLLTDAASLMLAEKQSCAVIVDDENLLVGLLTLSDIQEFAMFSKERKGEIRVSEVCCSSGGKCRVVWTATPSMNLLAAQLIMERYNIGQLPVIEDHRAFPVGVLDKECINLACRFYYFTL